ncbi:unnamed protein product, partial [Closterium sp. NIES-65]
VPHPDEILAALEISLRKVLSKEIGCLIFCSYELKDKRLCAASPSTCGLLAVARSAPRSWQHVRRLPAYKRRGTSPIRRVTGSCPGTTWLAGSASLEKRLQGVSSMSLWLSVSSVGSHTQSTPGWEFVISSSRGPVLRHTAPYPKKLQKADVNRFCRCCHRKFQLLQFGHCSVFQH